MIVKDVWYNHGRWLVRCPVCKQKNEIKPNADEVLFYCGGCYPGKFKRVPKPLPTGAVTWGYSKEKQREAASQAYANNEIHTAVMPDNWREAEKLLRLRRVPHQGFYPGNFAPPNDKEESVSNLVYENENDPDLFYLRKNKIEKKLSRKASVPTKKIDDKLFRKLQ